MRFPSIGSASLPPGSSFGLGSCGGAVLLAALVLSVGCGDNATDSPRQPSSPMVEPVPTAAAESSIELVRIAKAERETVFSGWKTATSGPEGGRQTRMKVSRLADGRTFMAWDQQGSHAMRWVYRSRHRWIDDPTLLASNYDIVEVAGEEATVAWRPARVIEVRPRRPGRPSMTMMVDAEHCLVLSEEIRDFEGATRFSWHFDTIEFDPAEAPEEWPQGAESAVSADDDEGAAEEPEPSAGRVQLERLPEGFRLVDRKAVLHGGVADYYSDGLAVFVLRQSPASSTSVSEEGELTCRSCSGRSEVSGTFGGIEVSILGNLPLEELEALAATLRVGN